MKSREEIIDYIKAGKLNTFRQNLLLSFILSFLLAGLFTIGYMHNKNKGILIAGLCFGACVFLLTCCIGFLKEKLLVSILQFSLTGLLSSVGFMIAANMLFFDTGFKSVWIVVGSSVIWCAEIVALLITEKKRFEKKTYHNANQFSRRTVIVSAVLTTVGIGLFRVAKHFLSENSRLMIITILSFILSYLLLTLCTAFIRVHLILKYNIKTAEVATELLKEEPLACFVNIKRLIISFFAGCLFYAMYCSVSFIMHSSVKSCQMIALLVLVYIGIPAISTIISTFKMNHPKNSALSMAIMYAVPIAVFWIVRALWIKNADGSTLSDALINTGLNFSVLINLVISVPALIICVHLHNKKKRDQQS